MKTILPDGTAKKALPSWAWDLAAFALIFLSVCGGINRLYAPSIMPDEMGYWCAGAFFSGNRWTDVMQTSPYYSYGYGLVLAPLFWLFQDPVWLFRGAIVLNAVFLCGSYLLSCALARGLFGHFRTGLRKGVCLCLTLYSYQIYNAQGTQPDAVMVFFYWLLVWLLVRLLKTARPVAAVPLAAVSCYLFTLHMRNLGILIALMMVLGGLVLLKKLSPRLLIAFLVSAALFFALALWVKAWYSGQVWGSSEFVDINNTSSAFGSVFSLFSIRGLVALFYNFLGRIFYLGCSTFLLFYWTVFVMVRDLWKAWKRRYLHRFQVVEIFLLLTMLGEIGISCLFMIEPTRMDHVLYGRYHEQVLGPLLLFGLMRLGQMRKHPRFAPLSVLIHLAQAGVFYLYFSSTNLEPVTAPPSMAGVVGFPYLSGIAVIIQYSFGIALCSVFVFLCVYLISCAHLRRHHLSAVALCLVAVCWVGLSYRAADDIFYSRNDAKAVFYDLTQDMADIWPEADIYYLVTSKQDDPANVFSNENFTLVSRKFFFPRTQVHLVTSAQLLAMDLPEDEPRFVICEETFVQPDTLLEDYVCLLQRGTTQVLIPRESPLPVSVYEEMLDLRLSTGSMQFSLELTPLVDDSGQWAAGMELPAYTPKDDSDDELAKVGIRYVQITDRALAQRMMEAGVPLEEHLTAPLHYDADELNTNGHASNGPADPMGLRSGQMQFGPYCALGAGTYRVTVHGDNLDGNARVRVHSSMGAAIYDIAPEQVTDEAIVYQMTLAEGCSDAELCVAAAGEETILITGLDIEWLAPGSEGILPTDRLPLASLRDAEGWVTATAALAEQVQALTGGEAADTNTYGPAQEADLAAMTVDGDGEVRGGAASLGAGGVLRGGALALEAGTYRITVTGTGLSRAGFAPLAGGGAESLPVQYLSSSDTRVQYLLVLEEGRADVELSAYGTDGQHRARITGITIERAQRQDAAGQGGEAA